MSFFKSLFGGNKKVETKKIEEAVSFTREGVRAKYMHKEYFTEIIKMFNQEYEDDKTMYEKLIRERGLNYEGYKTMEFVLGTNKETLVSLEFSKGSEIEKLKKYFEEAFSRYIAFWQSEDPSHEHDLRMLSLGILLNIDKYEYEKVANMYIKGGYEDNILGFIIHSQWPTYKIPTSLLFEDKACRTLQQIITLSKEEAEKGIKYYLEKVYYTKENLEEQYNAHLRNNKTYFGYWSFEAAAIVKIMGLDDSSFKDNEYYPYDMLHWNEK